MPPTNEPRKTKSQEPARSAGTPRSARTARTAADEAKPADGSRDERRALKLLNDLEESPISPIDTTTLDLVLRGGRGSVRGLVSDQEEYDSIRNSLMEAEGIADLELSLRVASQEREEAHDLARSVQLELECVGELHDADVQVACLLTTNGPRTLVLRGTVRRAIQRQLAGLVALRAVEGARLRNRLLLP